jgi:acyl carrier protein
MEIKTEVRQYVIENFLSDAPDAYLEYSTPLVTSGLIDSIGMIGLVDFIEGRFNIEFMPREIGVHNLNTLDQIEDLIRKKLSKQEIGTGR